MHEADFATEPEDTLEGKFLTFSLRNEKYGIEIRNVTEIIGIQHITDLPDVPLYVKGIINLRGKVIPVVDVRLRLNFEEREHDERTCIIIVNINDTTVGLIVDYVSEVLDIPADQIEPPAKLTRGTSTAYIHGFGKIGDRVTILIDTQKLLFIDDLEILEQAMPS